MKQSFEVNDTMVVDTLRRNGVVPGWPITAPQPQNIPKYKRHVNRRHERIEVRTVGCFASHSSSVLG